MGSAGVASEAMRNASGYDASNPPGMFSSGPVRYADGVLRYLTNDLESNGFGQAWGQTRSWSNAPGFTPNNTNGTGWIDSQLPYLISTTDVNDITTITVVTNGVNGRNFTQNGSTYTEHFFLQDKLTYSSTNKQFTFTDTAGDQMIFWDFSTSNPMNQRGQIQSWQDSAGNLAQ